MHSVKEISLLCNKSFRVDFEGSDLSSDAGLLLIKEFISKIGAEKFIKQYFKTNDTADSRLHKDDENILAKEALASQPTLSRFWNRMDQSTLNQLAAITMKLREIVYSVKMPQMILLDIDSTLLPTYGDQEGEAFNYHYQQHGYHPLLCYDGITGDLLKAELRDGTQYCSNGADDFIIPLLEEYSDRYPDVDLYLRGDSGFAAPDLYKACEKGVVNMQSVLRLTKR